MGIPGLARFMKNHFNKWRPARLSDWEKIVIDGNNICFPLYSSLEAQPFGGEYKRFKEKVESFFADFKNPIVVFDGSKVKEREGLLKKREDTMLKMHSNAKVPFPVLLTAVFKQALSAMGIEICHTSNTSGIDEDEADKHIAIIANELKSPVLSTDSDFFMFDLHHGFIYFDLLHQGNPEPLYNITDFMSEFFIKSKELCLILPLVFVRCDTKQIPSDNDFLSLLRKLRTVEYPSQFLAETGRDRSSFDRLRITYSVDAMPGVKEGATTTPEATRGVILSSLIRMQQERANIFPAVLEIIEERVPGASAERSGSIL